MPLPRSLPKRSLRPSLVRSTSARPLRPLRSPYICFECRLFSTTGHAAAEMESTPSDPEAGGTWQFMNGKRVFVREDGIRAKMRARQRELEQAAKQEMTERALPLGNLAQLGGSVGIVGSSGDGGATEEWTDDMVSLSGLTKMKLGELAELRSASGIVDLGIFIQNARSNTETGNAEFLTTHGMIVSHFSSRIMFSIPEFIPAEDMKHFKETYEATVEKMSSRDPVNAEPTSWIPPSDITNPIVKKLRKFQSDVEQLYFGKTAKFAELWERLAYKQQTRSITTEEAAEMVFGKDYDEAKLYATHCALVDDGLRFVGDKGYHRYTSRWRVRNRRDLKMLSTVTKWVRETTDVTVKLRPKMPVELSGFITKATQLIDRSRKLKEGGHGKEVEEVPIPQIPWNNFDLMIIDYLMTRLKGYGLQRTPLDGLAPHIIRATKRYEDVVFDGSTVFDFLAEIGAYKPWENLVLHSPFSNTPTFGAAPVADKMQAAYNKVQRLEQLELADSMKDLRKDWGSLPVYAVDDADAQEIDDGVSIEKLENGDCRVHVHIANPSAFIGTGHWVAKIAQERASTLYANPFIAGMLPPVVGTSLGLAPGSPVLTISILVDKDTHETKEVDIQPGIVNNVKRLTYQQFAGVAGCPKAQSFIINSTPIASTARAETPLPELAPEELETIKLLNDTAKNLLRARTRRGMLNLTSVSFTPSIDKSKFPLTTADCPSHIHPILYSGIPPVVSTVNPYPNPISAGNIIAEYMILANAAVATFCDQNEIPVPYRILEINPERPDLLEWYNEELHPSRDEFGHSPKTAQNITQTMQLAVPRLDYYAGPQIFMGLPNGYVRATSPLRRYADMITHWNLQHFIRSRAGMGSVTTPFPFDIPQMEATLPGLDMRERMNNFVSAEAQNLLHGLAITGALEQKKRGEIEELPWGDEPFAVQLSKSHEVHARGFAMRLGCNVKVDDPTGAILKRWREMERERIGSSGGILAQVIGFNVGDRMLMVRALGVGNDA